MKKLSCITNTLDWKFKFKKHLEELVSGKRNFVWYSFDNEDWLENEKPKLEKKLVDSGMKIMECMPFWVLVAYHPRVKVV